MKKSKLLSIGIFSFLTVVLVFFLLQFVFVSEEKKIERIIKTSKKAFEKEDLELLMGFLSKEYQDEFGLDYQGIREGLHETFSVFDEIKVSLSKVEVEVMDQEAEVKLSLWVFAKNQDQPVFLIGSLNNPVPSEVFLKKEEGEWKVVRIEIQY